MTTKAIIGFALLGMGLLLMVLGFNASRAPVEQVTEALTGNYTDRTMWYLLGGAIAIMAGLVLTFMNRRV
ncbi:MAG: DUF3185 family protein [Alphaproteobacteria bacterium]|nr:DUF3185 family protein [Alphaproteobacteria bacterium]